MIRVEKETDDFYLNTKVYENCVFCRQPTRYWHTKTNNPVCQGCAKIHKVSELRNHFKKKQP